eukprot:scaffold7967_cov81-Skeletonema_dohrnii-CCMP3373.AAC.4
MHHLPKEQLAELDIGKRQGARHHELFTIESGVMDAYFSLHRHTQTPRAEPNSVAVGTTGLTPPTKCRFTISS